MRTHAGLTRCRPPPTGGIAVRPVGEGWRRQAPRVRCHTACLSLTVEKVVQLKATAAFLGLWGAGVGPRGKHLSEGSSRHAWSVRTCACCVLCARVVSACSLHTRMDGLRGVCVWSSHVLRVGCVLYMVYVWSPHVWCVPACCAWSVCGPRGVSTCMVCVWLCVVCPCVRVGSGPLLCLSPEQNRVRRNLAT